MMKRALILLGLIAFAFCYVPPPQLGFAQFAGQQLATSTGSANAQSVPLANYRLQVGVPITFVVGFGLTNTDVTTLNVNSTGSISFKRVTQVGLFEMVGGELPEGGIVTAMYDGTQYKLINVPVIMVAQRIELRTSLLPQGYAYEDGSCYSNTSLRFAALTAAIASTYGTCGASVSRLPDSRGRGTAAEDGQGSNGSGNQLTTGLNGCNAILGNVCFSPFYNQTIGQLPTFTPAGGFASGSVAVSVSDTRTWRLNSGQPSAVVTGTTYSSAGGTGIGTGPDNSVIVSGGSISGSFNPNVLAFSGTPIGSGANIFFFPPNSIVRSAIKL